jgi:hypothetical protein
MAWIVFLLAKSSAFADPAELRAARTVERMGGKVIREGRVIGPYVVDVVVGVKLNMTRATDADLKELAVFKHLRTLDLFGTRVTDAGLKELIALEKLEELDLTFTKVTSAGAEQLTALTRLQRLDVDWRISENGVVALKKARPHLIIRTFVR